MEDVFDAQVKEISDTTLAVGTGYVPLAFAFSDGSSRWGSGVKASRCGRACLPCRRAFSCVLFADRALPPPPSSPPKGLTTTQLGSW